MINYRYGILEKLGEGGSGEVFLAEDQRRANQHVAIKILHPFEKSGAEANDAFQNEVSALVSLSHPNLVRIFDFGTIRHAEETSLQQRRYFTMEVIRGADALEWISAINNVEDRDAKLEMLLLQALSVLSYVHHEGVIHFDIKPQNFIIIGEREATSTPVLKLTDFGFSKKTDDALDIPIRGTLEYTAPELLQGKPYDHRIDLYSLGATFYHLLEGHCPFEANEPVELAKHVLSDEVTFSERAGSRNLRLREVILQLMQKNPARRSKSAQDAARMLTGNMPQGKELFESFFGFARKPKFVGRHDERQTIQKAVASLAHVSAERVQSAIVISGGEGIGKTALLKEALKSARAKEIAVYEITSLQTDVPFGAIAPTLDLLAGDVRSFSDQGNTLFEKYNQLLGFGRDEAARFETWGEQKENVVELASRFLIECSEVFPLIIGVDDAQLLDESSLSILKITIRDVAGRPLLLVAAELSAQANVFPLPLIRELSLHDLALEEILEMSRGVLGVGSVADEIGSKIYALYGGTPGIIVEALNAVSLIVPSEALQDPLRAKEYLQNLEAKLPRNIDDFLVSRYQKLSRERQLIVSMLSCFCFPARTAVLMRLLPFHPERSAEHVRFLQLDGFVDTAENGSVLFLRMKKLKDAVYETISSERDELHALIASLLEQDSSVKDFTQLQETAYQFSQCRAYEQACAYYEKAADEGVKLFALQRALALYRDALEAAGLSAQAERTSQLEVKYASVLFRSGSYQEAIELSRSLIKRQQLSNAEKIAMFRVIGLSSSRLGEYGPAQEYINLVLQLSPNEIERLELRQEFVALQITAGHFKEAQNESLDQLERAQALHNDRLVGAIYTDLGIVTFFQDRFDGAVQYFQSALKTYEALSEKTQVVNSMNNIGNALSAKGDFPQAIAYWEKALKASQEYGTMNQQALIQNNLGIAYYNLKKYREAKEYYTEARSKYERIGSRIGTAQALSNLGEVLFAEGEYESALNSWSEARELFESMENVHGLTESCLELARVFSYFGDMVGMNARLDDAETLIAKNGLDTFAGKYHLLRGTCQLNMGELDPAEKSFEVARTLFLADKGKESYWLSTLRRAECFVKQAKPADAATVIAEVLTSPEAIKLPLIIGEANYLYGTLATAKQEIVTEKAIVYFKRGIEAIAKEPVCEITWKLAFALAREYYERGQQDRAKEFLVKTKLILQFFISHFSTPELKKQYLAVDQKERVFATIEAITKTKS